MCLLVVSGHGSVSHTGTARARSQKTESEEARHVLSGPFIIKNVYLNAARQESKASKKRSFLNLIRKISECQQKLGFAEGCQSFNGCSSKLTKVSNML